MNFCRLPSFKYPALTIQNGCSASGPEAHHVLRRSQASLLEAAAVEAPEVAARRTLLVRGQVDLVFTVHVGEDLILIPFPGFLSRQGVVDVAPAEATGRVAEVDGFEAAFVQLGVPSHQVFSSAARNVLGTGLSLRDGGPARLRGGTSEVAASRASLEVHSFCMNGDELFEFLWR